MKKISLKKQIWIWFILGGVGICTLGWGKDIDLFKPFIRLQKAQKPIKQEKLLPTQRLKFSEITLKGIIWRKKDALALIEDSTGKGYILKKGDPLGTGYVKAIKQDRIVIEVSYTNIFGKKEKKLIEIVLPKKKEANLP